MRRHATVALVLLAGLLLGACREAPPLDATDPRSVAHHVMDAWADKDAERLATLTTPAQAEILRRTRKGDATWRTLFGNTFRWRAARRWEGQLGPARVRGDRARIQIAQLNNLEVVVVALRRDGDRWLLDDLLSPSLERFQSWGEPLP